MMRIMVSCFLVLAMCSVSAFAVPMTVPTSLAVGAQYRLAFLTTARTTAISGDIETYNTFVTNEANAQAELAALGTTWKAIGSTAAVDARDNTGTNPSCNVVREAFHRTFAWEDTQKIREENKRNNSWGYWFGSARAIFRTFLIFVFVVLSVLVPLIFLILIRFLVYLCGKREKDFRTFWIELMGEDWSE